MLPVELELLGREKRRDKEGETNSGIQKLNVASVLYEKKEYTESPPKVVAPSMKMHWSSNEMKRWLVNEDGGEDGLYMRGDLGRAVAILTRVRLLLFP